MRKNVVDRCNRSDQVTGFSKFQLFTFWVHFEEKNAIYWKILTNLKITLRRYRHSFKTKKN